ncbi:MSCRAMM family collagen-binding adhesin EcbA [Enterococcus casseliflavus]|uniref:MSCRAMM family collagen-binding adhesin EcbA n=1 Tax=Enterococcus casseliflavus TaxID=37734 RepID=UPI003D0F9B73
MFKRINKRWRLLAIFSLIYQTIGGMFTALPVYADEFSYPQSVTIQYDLEHLYTVDGTFRDGRTLKERTTPLYAIYNGIKQDVFCIEPGVPIPNSTTPGYEKNPLPNMSDKAKLISVLWSNVGKDRDTHMVAQKMIWEEVNGYNLEYIKRSDGSFLDIATIEDKINNAISVYQKKPSFNGKSIQTVLGKSTTLTDENGINLSEFDKVVENTANIDFHVNGNHLTLTPNQNSKDGTLTLQKSAGFGTPVAYKKSGQQTVMAGAIDKPTTYSLKINVENKGNLKVLKVDKESGSPVPNTTFHLDFGNSFPSKDVETGSDGSVIVDNIPHGTKVLITEKSVPSPYVIDKTPMEAVIQAGETIAVTSKNYREKGQIVIDKVGLETKMVPWNEHYSLEGNIFDIRKDSPDGEIVKSIATDSNGHAETSDKITEGLELGTYYVTERKASNGFVNTFKPVKVELKYHNQTVDIVRTTVKGTNKEITGSSFLTKQDKETGIIPQGKATFNGAEYTLYYAEDSNKHKAGTPVKWNDNFNPVLVKGTKASEETITLSMNEKSQLGVKHLAIGKYYWKESKAPEGYSIDKTKYNVEISKVDDSLENAIIEKNVVAQEQVIRINFDFFKFASSISGTTKSGFNDVPFRITPLDGTRRITGGTDQVTTSYNNELGFDGYGKFENLPYGDYQLEEVEAPKGFKKIQPLIIKSSFKENKLDYYKSQYIFTITEKGQSDPIKTVTIPYSELTHQNFSVSLNRLMLYDLPEEENSVTSLAIWKSGTKNLTENIDTDLIDNLSYNLNKVNNTWYVVSKAIDLNATKDLLVKNKNGEPVVISELATKLSNKEKSGTWKLIHKLTLNQISNKTIVLFNYVYESEQAYLNGEKPVAVDDNLDNPAQTVTVSISSDITIKTRAHLKDESQTFMYGDIVDMYDDIEITHKSFGGEEESFETILYAVLPDGTAKSTWKSNRIKYKVDDKIFVKTILAKSIDTSKYPKGTYFTFSENNYDSAGKINGKHNENLKEKTQTLIPKEELPKETNSRVKPSQKALPQTGSKESKGLVLIGVIFITISSCVYFWKRKK